MTDDDRLLAALAAIQVRGAIGDVSLEAAVRHADQFVTSIPAEAVRLADLGSGGGLPGLVIAVRRADLSVVLVERRATRADLLRRAVRSLDLVDRVSVHGADVATLADRAGGTFDVVTARSFAAPEITARWGSELLRVGGLLIVSEPPTDDQLRWPPALLESRQLLDLGRDQGVRRFQRV